MCFPHQTSMTQRASFPQNRRPWSCPLSKLGRKQWGQILALFDPVKIRGGMSERSQKSTEKAQTFVWRSSNRHHCSHRVQLAITCEITASIITRLTRSQQPLVPLSFYRRSSHAQHTNALYRSPSGLLLAAKWTLEVAQHPVHRSFVVSITTLGGCFDQTQKQTHFCQRRFEWAHSSVDCLNLVVHRMTSLRCHQNRSDTLGVWSVLIPLRQWNTQRTVRWTTGLHDTATQRPVVESVHAVPVRQYWTLWSYLLQRMTPANRVCVWERWAGLSYTGQRVTASARSGSATLNILS